MRYSYGRECIVHLEEQINWILDIDSHEVQLWKRVYCAFREE